MQKTTSSSLFNKKKYLHLGEEVRFFVQKQDFQQSRELAEFLFKHQAIQHLLSFLDYKFDNKILLLTALSHTSFVHEVSELDLNSNEKLEFLGDAVLDLLISSYLMEKYSELSEGELSRFRSSLVNQSSLAELARFCGMGKCILMGKGELKTRGGEKDALLANAFEAIIGAIYLDSSFAQVNKALQFLLDLYKRKTGHQFMSTDRFFAFDAKTKLQEKTMASLKLLPEYRAYQLDNSMFKVELYIGENLIGTVVEKSKKKAEQELAHQALAKQVFGEKGSDYVN